jgi:L-alanine-DL-glutamate epimerase-like enolase superfamily enzyme
MAFSRRSFLAAASMSAAAPAMAQRGGKEAAPRGSGPRRAHPLEGIGREDLKITDVKCTLLSYELPANKRWVTGRSVIWKTDAILVQVFTDKGIVGIGEPTPYAGPERVKPFVEEHLKPAVMGLNPFDVEQIAGYWGDGFSKGFNARLGWAGFDVACWDVIGKAKGMPVYKLLTTDGPPNPHIRMYASGGVEYAWYKRPEDLIDEAVRHKEQGYTAFKYRVGTDWKASGMTLQKYIPYVRKLREAVGPNMDLMQESNMRLTFEECMELCPVLEELKFLWFEEPVNTRKPDALERYIDINRALPKVMVSGGEQLVHRFDFKEWIDRGAYDIVQPDANTTGITEMWHIARLARLKNKYCCPHNWHGGLTTMANAAVVAAIPNHLVLELNQTFNPFKEEVFKDPLVVKKGYMDLPNKPGYGVELAAGLERKFPYLPGRYDRPNPDLPSA